MTWKELYSKTVDDLRKLRIEESQSEADIIFEYYFGMNKIKIILQGDEKSSENAIVKINEVLSKREKGIPIQYILGEWSFRNLKFKVGKGVLVPRDDTNVLVDAAIEFLKFKNRPCVIDLCSGSGCVAISLEKELNSQNPEVFGVELSKHAFNYFESNIETNRSNVKAISGDALKVYSEFENEKFDAVISNPPYIKTSEIENLQVEVKCEPKMALDGGKDGLYFYRNICKNWIPKLKIGGMIAFEIGLGQENEVGKLLEISGAYCVKTYRDINNIVRAVSGIKKAAP